MEKIVPIEEYIKREIKYRSFPSTSQERTKIDDAVIIVLQNLLEFIKSIE